MLKKVLLTILMFGICILLYLVSPREFFPFTHYSNEAIISSGYQNQTRHQHIYLQQSYKTTDGDIRYLDLGPKDAPVLLLLHGTPTSSRMYRKVIAGLVSEGNYRIIAPDMLGFGNSDKPFGENLYTTKQQSDRIKNLMDHVGVSQWDQVIHDMAGTWTWKFLQEHPGHIRKLLILNAVGFAEGFNPPAMMKSRPSMGYYFSKLITIDLFSRLIMKQTIKGMTNKPSEIDKTIIDGYLYPTLQGQWRIYGHFLSNLDAVIQELQMHHSFLSKHQELLPKTFLIRGAKDSILSVSQVEMFKQQRGIPEKNITILATGTHLVAEDYPEIIIEKLLNR